MYIHRSLIVDRDFSYYFIVVHPCRYYQSARALYLTCIYKVCILKLCSRRKLALLAAGPQLQNSKLVTKHLLLNCSLDNIVFSVHVARKVFKNGLRLLLNIETN